MNKIFLDTNVILDFLLAREPFADNIAEILENANNQSIQLCISSLSISNINYIIGRIEGKKKAKIKTEKLIQLIKIDSVGQSTITKAMTSKFKDFEVGIQNFCAEEAGHIIIVTRNVKDYKTSKLSIMTPTEYLSIMMNNN